MLGIGSSSGSSTVLTHVLPLWPTAQTIRREKRPSFIGQRARACLQELAHSQEAIGQANVARSKGKTCSHQFRLFSYLSESYLPAEHNFGQSPIDNTQNQAQFQVISPAMAGAQLELRRGWKSTSCFPKGLGHQSWTKHQDSYCGC